jgi:anaerobic dimethyl sulfoxide reductase subunit A
MELGELILRQQALEPMGESRTLFDICAGVARRLNIEDMFTEGRNHDQWVEYMYQQCRTVKPELPEYFQEAFNIGLFKWKRPGKPAVAFQDFRRNPLQYPLKTPSGKIEIFSRSLWEKAQAWDLPEDDVITALPEYHPSWGDPVAALTKEYPLQCIGHHYKQRTHSSFGNNTWLQEAAPQMVWINPLDAGARGIEHGDTVRIFNQFGETQVKAKVTPRIMPGVLSLPQGAWHQANQNGADTNGCINVLTSQRPSPLAKGNPQHTNLVQAEKVTGRKGSVRQACIFP